MRTPVVTGHGIAGGEAYLLLEFLDLERHGDFAALGRMLAEAHRKPRPRFGFTQDNYIGTTRQQNGWSENWAEFWRQRRMKPQLELAGKNGFDLGEVGWSGNVGFTADGPVVFDPAVYYGDREADVAMTELFGGFPREFYASYDEAFPLDPGYEKRKHLYNLYHLLNHLNLFGGGYLAQVKSTLSLLGLQ
jgi:protein-ribulosamine 3-kinase